MANKLKWFTHDHDAHDDPFICALMDRFGLAGYASYFIILELMHRDGQGDELAISASRLCQKLRSRRTQVGLLLDFCRTSSKIEFTWSGDEVHLQIKKFRERQSKMKSKIPSTFRQPSSNLPLEGEGEREGERQTDICAVEPKPTRPSLEDVSAYCMSRGGKVDAQRWMDHYTSNGFKVGRNPMKDWKACVRNWERNSNSPAKGSSLPATPQTDSPRIRAGRGDPALRPDAHPDWNRMSFSERDEVLAIYKAAMDRNESRRITERNLKMREEAES